MKEEITANELYDTLSSILPAADIHTRKAVECERIIGWVSELQGYRMLDNRLQCATGMSLKQMCDNWNVIQSDYLRYQQLGTVEELQKALRERTTRNESGNKRTETSSCF